MAVRVQAGRAQGSMRGSDNTVEAVATSSPASPHLGARLTILLEQAGLILSYFADESTEA